MEEHRSSLGGDCDVISWTDQNKQTWEGQQMWWADSYFSKTHGEGQIQE